MYCGDQYLCYHQPAVQTGKPALRPVGLAWRRLPSGGGGSGALAVSRSERRRWDLGRAMESCGRVPLSRSSRGLRRQSTHGGLASGARWRPCSNLAGRRAPVAFRAGGVRWLLRLAVGRPSLRLAGAGAARIESSLAAGGEHEGGGMCPDLLKFLDSKACFHVR
ncbi:hypothetical protein E2562_017676 [Oryza meyeriana var. granulata]|uniref:Uncharacterized protein n=1 Tax=Oryza meyeriana var. granulata TaxID=110450 RepID=A0A6G1BXU3_9ORYZ|nr:hypothetical protein E2562_017676 [Oryza meyeriana var. granulata]